MYIYVYICLIMFTCVHLDAHIYPYTCIHLRLITVPCFTRACLNSLLHSSRWGGVWSESRCVAQFNVASLLFSAENTNLPYSNAFAIFRVCLVLRYGYPLVWLAIISSAVVGAVSKKLLAHKCGASWDADAAVSHAPKMLSDTEFRTSLYDYRRYVPLGCHYKEYLNNGVLMVSGCGNEMVFWWCLDGVLMI